MLRKHLEDLRRLLFVVYLCVVAFSFQVSTLIESLVSENRLDFNIHNNHFLFVILIWGLVLWNQKSCYLFRLKSNIEILKPAASASFKASAMYLIYLYFIRFPVQGRFQVGIFLILSLISLNLLRLIINIALQHYRRRGFNYQTVVIVGNGKKAKEFADKIFNNAKWGYKIIGFIDNDVTSNNETIRPRLWSYRDIPSIGSSDDLPDIIKSQQVDWVVFALENDKLKQVEPAVVACQEMGTRVAVLADLYPAIYTRMRPGEFFDYPILLFDTIKQRGRNLVIKEIIDRLAAGLGIILVSPILLFASLAIKIFSKGSILFKQKRLGLNGKEFMMYKFRTMVADAEKLKDSLEKHNEMDGPAFKIENDPRITRIGKLLRKTSIDELPQLFNVIKGDMSLVGPRPPLLKEVKKYDPWQRRRLSIKPGITCLWQVMGRNNISFEKWMKLDLEYIDNWSLWLDTKILARTIPAVLTRKGAK